MSPIVLLYSSPRTQPQPSGTLAHTALRVSMLNLFSSVDRFYLDGQAKRYVGSRIDLTRPIDRKRRVDTAFKVCPGLYRAIAEPKARRKTYQQFPPSFFDLIVIDEFHRGSTADDSAWREIPEYFSPATRIGLTATPKEV